MTGLRAILYDSTVCSIERALLKMSFIYFKTRGKFKLYSTYMKNCQKWSAATSNSAHTTK